MKPRTLLHALGAALIVLAVLGLNGSIYYSSVPHYHQQGWAEFCGLNAIWIAVLGVLVLCFSESHEVDMRQLDWETERSRGRAD